ncbi:MAG: hypothetical protein EP329_01875 [Deltaproteobacteria bacterium]|nr:MAG: hypothetical protein EP329_01875 [Deltaproteobacteria bacterium]
MHPRTRRRLAVTAAATFALWAGCAELETDATADATGSDTLGSPDGTTTGLSCVGCHTDEEALKAVLPPPEEPAEEIEGTGDG